MAFRTQKISQMTPKGANLEATDLIEVSTIESGSYVTRSITGQEIIDAAVGNVDWGDIGGTLSAQTDLQSALDAKVPTSRTLTINGVTQDLSANRTFTISTGITIGSTAIASGTVGRILFEGAGNVVQESSSLSYDDTAKSFTLSGNQNAGINYISENTSTGLFGNSGFLVKNSAGNIGALSTYSTGNGTAYLRSNFVLSSLPSASNVIIATSFDVSGGGTGNIQLATGGYGGNPTKMTVFGTTGNVLLQNGGTHTDAGFRLDVNGTARFKDTGSNSSIVMNYATGGYIAINNASASETIRLRAGGGASWFNTGQNLLIGTTTDAGFRLDVNGTARVQSQLTVQGMQITTAGSTNQDSVVIGKEAHPNSIAFSNVAIGYRSLYVNTGGDNVAIGSFSLRNNTTGTRNTGIGWFALNGNVTGQRNSAIGYNTQSGNFDGSVILGYEAAATASNQFVVGSVGTPAGSVTSELNTSTQVWNVVINGVPRKILLA